MAKYKLGDICEIVSGSTPKTSIEEYWDGDIKWITPAEINDDTYIVTDSVRKITDLGAKKTGLSPFPEGTVILSSRAPIGKVAIAGCAMCCNQGFKNLICSEKILNKYLYWFLKGNTSFLNSLGRGATFKEISKSIVSQIEINVPDIEYQKEAADILEKVSEVIYLRKQELTALDNLINARFVEMFGTLDTPTQAFEKATLKELCNKITDGKHGGCKSEVGTERYFVGAREIYDDDVHYELAPEINIEEFEKDYKRCNVEIGDFLIVNTGATIGKSAIACDKRTEHTLLQKSVALLKVKKDVLNPIFLKWCYRVNTKMYMVENASAQPNLLLSKINATVIYVPDIELQNQFADFVHQVNKSKVAVQKALDETQMLFDSLMQEYFG
ncbi:restriction endonuclease subunit S [Agathobacter rectalis]|jgi:type I restriction enzyme S subunit|uniref:restriction endonuclease subunit S n=1 Tax=Agathobacter rectalis TaxID=39491 RepID=UPI0027D258DC|nr:restriction endonuclease subunit S [Agathobacter rectalis]MDB8008202.1 restriction endonuclease subunit S [Agathobacter rectalis]MDB8012108.1 restriction endonuclease subunit S [Agathobacter rectalis]